MWMCFLSLCGLGFSHGETKTYKELTLVNGKKYQSVTIRKIEPDGIRIMHASGMAKIPYEKLNQEIQEELGGFDPEKAQAFREKNAGHGSSVKPKQNQKSSQAEDDAPEQGDTWMPTSVEDVMDCSLFVKVKEGVDEDGNSASWNGSAFLVNHGKTTYIYSNVHNFDGAKKYEIVDRKGKRYSDFLSVQVAAEGQGYYAPNKWGGDVIRIRLKHYRPKALTIEKKKLDPKASKGRKIVVTGNTRAEGIITRLEGVINRVDQHGIIHHTAATEGGNSGSPIVDMQTFKVIGILTWGSLDTRNPLDLIWLKKNPDATNRQTRAWGASLAGMKYVPCSFTQLYRQRLAVNNLKRNVRLMGLMDFLYPTKQGILLYPDRRVFGDYTVRDILQESSRSPVIKELIALDRELGKYADSNIGISNQDMLKKYIQTYSRCLGLLQRQRRTVDTRNLTYFMQCNLKNTYALEICVAYEKSIAKTINWCRKQRGIGGKAIPFAKRWRLPKYQSGLNGLGILGLPKE